MQFKQCKYYEKSIERENCPFANVCGTDCYFTLKRKNDELVKENEDLTDIIDDLSYRLNNCESGEE